MQHNPCTRNKTELQRERCHDPLCAPSKLGRFGISLAILLLTATCASRTAFRKGEEAYQKNEIDQAVQYYMRALQSEPENVRYRFALGRSLVSASNYHLHRGQEMLEAGDARVALFEFNKALENNPGNNEARRQKDGLLKRLAEEKKKEESSDLEVLKEKVAQSESERAPKLQPENEPFNLKMGEADLAVILRALQSLSGVRILFDKNFQSQKLTVDLDRVSFKEALEKVLIQTRNFYKVIDERTIIVIPDDPKKKAEYNELVMRTFFLSNADLKQVEKEVRELVGIKTVGTNETLNSITLRDTPNKIAVAEKLIRTLDKARAELLIDVEILEVNRRRMKKYGVELSQYYVSEFLNPWPVTDLSKVTSGSPVRGTQLKHLNLSDFFFNLPSVAYKLMQEDSLTKVKAKPQLRVVDQEEEVVHLGDKVPILQTSFVPNYGTSSTSTLNQNPINSYNYADIGIMIKLTPRVHHDGWITMKLEFELTFITEAGTDTRPPTIGTRNVKSVIRLQDNETGILAGLLRDNERSSVKGLPGLVNLPIVKEIFSSNDKEIEQTDIILTITPHIIKFPDIDEDDLRSYYVGTEENIGLKESLPASPFDKEKKETPVVVPSVKPQPSPPKTPAKTQPGAVPAAGGTQTAPAEMHEGIRPSSQEPDSSSQIPNEPASREEPAVTGGTQEIPAEEATPPPSERSEQENPSQVDESAPPLPSQEQDKSAVSEQESTARLSLVSSSQTLAVGQSQTLDLIIENVKEFQMLDGELRFPADKLHIERVDTGDFVRAHGGNVTPVIDNATGKLKLSVILGGMASNVRQEKLAVVQVKAIAAGEATVSSSEMHVLDPRLQELPASFQAPTLTVTKADGKEP